MTDSTMASNMDEQPTAHTEAESSQQTEGSGWRTWTDVSVAALTCLLLVDAGIETFASGSSVRWLVVGAVASFAVALLIAWRVAPRSVGRVSGRLTSLSGGLVLGLIAGTVWLPRGTTDGIRMVGQTTSTLLAIVSGTAVALAGVSLVRRPFRAGWVRYTIGILAAYGVLSFALALLSRTPYAALFHGASFWRLAPYWLQGAWIGGLVVVPAALVMSVAETSAGQRRGWPNRLLSRQLAVLVASITIAVAALRTSEGERGFPLRVPGSGAAVDDLRAEAAPVLTSLRLDEQSRRLQAASFLDALFTGLERSARELPGDGYDLQAVVDKVGRDPERLKAWVLDNTTWVPYRGSLRGTLGVLLDRTGNDLDRSLLLAELLRAAGHTVQLAHNVLSPAQASERLQRVRLAPPRTPLTTQSVPVALPDDPELRDLLNGFRQTGDEDRNEGRRRFADARQRIDRQVSQVLSTLRLAPASASVEARLTAMSDHWWVQVQEQGVWKDLDVTPGPTGSADDVAVHDVVVPGPDGRIRLGAELCHEIVLRVIVEQWDGSRLVEHPVLEHSIRPADIIGQTITLHHVGLPKDAPGGPAFKAALIAQDKWVPVLRVGDSVAAPSVIHGNGEVTPRPSGAAAKIRGGSANVVGGLLGGLGGDEEPASTLLTAEWIEYELRQPGSAPARQRHEIFDLVGPAARVAGPSVEPRQDEAMRLRRALTLLGTTEILIQVGDVPAEFVLASMAHQALADRPAWLEALRTEDSARRRNLLSTLQNASVYLGPLNAYALARQQLAGERREVFQDSIGLVNLRWAGDVDSSGALVSQELMDIVANRVAAASVGADTALAAVIRQGIVDTVAEQFVMGSVSEPENTSTIFSRAEAMGIGHVAFRPPAVEGLRDVPLQADVRVRVERDLAAGFAVVLPARTVNGRVGWWRIDPATGATVGVMDSGFHQGTTEKVEIDGEVDSGDTAALSKQPRVRRADPRLGEAGETPLKLLKKMGIDESHPQFKEYLDAICDLQDALMKALKYLDKMEGLD